MDEVNKYLVDENSEEQFVNIMNFLKNTTLKDSKKIDSAENEISREFRRLLIKYYEDELDDNDISSLLDIVKKYNDSVDSWIDKYIEKENIAEENQQNVREYYSSYLKIYVKLLQATGNTKKTKRSVSIMESQWAMHNEPLSFFYLKDIPSQNMDMYQKYGEVFGDLGGKVITNTAAKRREADTSYISFIVLYKEFNPVYRDVLRSELFERIWAILQKDNKLVQESNADGEHLSYQVPSKVRSFNYTARDEADKEKDMKEMVAEKGYLAHHIDLEKFNNINSDFYGSPYCASIAVESDIISFFYGKNEYINLNYGDESYEILEIYNFLNIFKETRDYYYKVLLNESFTSDEDYRTYSQLFITFWAVERFITSKIENLKDIDLFNREDTVNFLKSYGLGVLADRLVNNDFFNSEKYTKQILKHYNKLMQNKGSKNVIELLQNIFDIDSSDVDIKKYIMVRKVASPSSSSGDSIVFSEVPYTSNNQTLDIYNTLAKNTDIAYDTLILDDPYWNITQVPVEDVKASSLNTSETKYLSLTLKENFYKTYILARYFLSIVPVLYDKMFKDKDGKEIISMPLIPAFSVGDISVGSTSLNDIAKLANTVFSRVLDIYDAIAPRGTTKELLYYGLNLDKLDETLSGIKLCKNPNSSSSGVSVKAVLETIYDNINGLATITGNIPKDISELYLLKNNDTGVDYSKIFLIYNETPLTETGRHSVLNMLTYLKGLSVLLTDDISDYIKSLYKASYIIANKTSYNDNGGDIDAILPSNPSSFYELIYAPLLEIPVTIFDGTIFTDTNLNPSSVFFDDVFEIFNKLFMTSAPVPNKYDEDVKSSDIYKVLIENNNIIYEGENWKPIEIAGSVDIDIANEQLEELLKILVGILNAVRNANASAELYKFKIASQSDTQKELDFLEETVEIFISYTVNIKEVRYTQEYNTQSERIPVNDFLNINISTTKVDNVYLDDKFTISESTTKNEELEGGE